VQRSEANSQRYYDWKDSADYYRPPPAHPAAKGKGIKPHDEGSASLSTAGEEPLQGHSAPQKPAAAPLSTHADKLTAAKLAMRLPARGGGEGPRVPSLQIPLREAEGQLLCETNGAGPAAVKRYPLSPVSSRSPVQRENPCVEGESYLPGSPTRHILGNLIPHCYPAAISSLMCRVWTDTLPYFPPAELAVNHVF
jgi:hypothetical protein